MKKRLLSTLLVLAMICTMLPTVVFAEEAGSSGTTLDSTLTLDNSAYGGAIGFAWTDSGNDGSYDTLTLTDDLTITLESTTTGIKFDSAATIDLNGHDLTINGADVGISVTGYDLTIKDDSGNEIKGTLTISETTATTISSGALTLENITLIDSSYAQWTGAGITLDGAYDVTINNSTVTTYQIYTEGECSIDADSTITADIISAKDITIADGAIIQAYVRNTSGSTQDTVYGSCIVTSSASGRFSDGTLTFQSGATLTIEEGVVLDLSGYDITWDNATIINNGVLTLPSGTEYTDVVPTYITNKDTIIIGTTAYDSNGNTMAVLPYYGTLDLTSGNAFDGSLYGFTWAESTNTLTINKSGLTIIVNNGTEVSHGLKVPANTTIVLNGPLNITTSGDGISASGALTIKGTGDVTITAGEDGIGASGNIDISGGTFNITAGGSGIGAGGNITISGGTFEIEADSHGIDAYNGDITIGGSSKVTVKTIGYKPTA